MKVRVVINEQHKLLPAQEEALNEAFGEDWVIYAIPAEGLDRKTMSRLLSLWHAEVISGPWARIVFASPIPYLLAFCAADENIGTWLFHNDKRIAKEVP